MDSKIHKSKKIRQYNLRTFSVDLRSVPILKFKDLVEVDQIDDVCLSISERQLSRLLCTAAVTGARFERERRVTDPVEWMYLPQAVFSGRAAVQACADRNAYRRGMIVHGLALSGLTKPGQIDRLFWSEIGCAGLPVEMMRAADERQERELHLFTASISDMSNSGRSLVFIALLACDAEEVWAQVCDRFGEKAANLASIRRGFDPSEPIALALVSEPLGDTLQLAADAPTSRLAEGLDVQIESRFLN